MTEYGKNLDSSYNAMLYRNCSKVVQALLYGGGYIWGIGL